MLAALGFMVVGGILVYAAFQTPPDPRAVLGQAFGVKVRGTQATGGIGGNPRATRTRH